MLSKRRVEVCKMALRPYSVGSSHNAKNNRYSLAKFYNPLNFLIVISFSIMLNFFKVSIVNSIQHNELPYAYNIVSI